MRKIWKIVGILAGVSVSLVGGAALVLFAAPGLMATVPAMLASGVSKITGIAIGLLGNGGTLASSSISIASQFTLGTALLTPTNVAHGVAVAAVLGLMAYTAAEGERPPSSVPPQPSLTPRAPALATGS